MSLTPDDRAVEIVENWRSTAWEKDSDLRELIRQHITDAVADEVARLWDADSVICDNCSCELMKRGGSLEHCGLIESDGEKEALCGYCAGLELKEAEALIQAFNDKPTQLDAKVWYELTTELLALRKKCAEACKLDAALKATEVTA